MSEVPNVYDQVVSCLKKCKTELTADPIDRKPLQDFFLEIINNKELFAKTDQDDDLTDLNELYQEKYHYFGNYKFFSRLGYTTPVNYCEINIPGRLSQENQVTPYRFYLNELLRPEVLIVQTDIDHYPEGPSIDLEIVLQTLDELISHYLEIGGT